MMSRTNVLRLAGAVMVVMTILAARSYSQEDEGRQGRSHSSEPCSNRTLSGDYAFTIDGTVFAGPATALVRGVAMTHFDGHGGLTQVDYASINGAPLSADWRPAAGFYAINSNCTGTAEIDGAGGPPIRLHLVVGEQGKRIFTVVDGNASGSTGIKRD